MFNLMSENQSKGSLKIPPDADQNSADSDIIVTPRESRRHSVQEDEHHKRLGEHSAVLYKFNKFTDVTVKLNDEKFPSHKTVLSCYSRYLKNMLLESKDNVTVIELKLEDVTNEAFSILLQYMYSADLDINCQNIGEVYTAAQKLGMDGAISICSKILQGKERREVHSVYVFVTARKLRLNEDASRALRCMCRKFEHIVGTQEYLDLDYKQVVEYLSTDELATRSEVIVYLAALKWLSNEYLDREQYAVAVISCVRFPLMTLNEVLACHSPPLLPGLVEMPAIHAMLLRGTCFVASKTINEEKRFQRYNCSNRTYLLERKPVILWDPSIFDPDRYALYKEEVSASTIQAYFRDYKTKQAHKEKEEAAEVIQKAFRRHSQQVQEEQDQEDQDQEDQDQEDQDQEDQDQEDQDQEDQDQDDQDQEDQEGSSIEEDSDQEYVQDVDKDNGSESDGSIFGPLAERIRKSVHSIFSRSSTSKEEGSEERIIETQHSLPSRNKSSDSRNKASSRGRKSSNWRTPYESSSVVQDLEKRDSDRHKDVDKDYSKESEEDDDRAESKNKRRRSKQDLKHVAKSVTKLAKTVQDNDNEEDTYGAIIISGGFNGDNEDHPDSGKLLMIYEPAVGEWSTLGEMFKPRHHHRVVYLKGFIYCIGGCNPERTKRKEKMVPVKSCYAFDITSRTWNKIAEMRHCRVYHATAVLNGKIYVAGGKDEKDCMLNTVEVYDPDLDSWELLYDPLYSPTIGAGMCSKDGKLWVIGGMLQDSTGKIFVSKKVRCYDPKTEEWTRIASLPFPRAFVGAVVCGKRIFVVGGSSHAGPSSPSEEMSSFDDVFFYDGAEKKWQNAPRLPAPRHFVGAVAVYKSLFVLGGLTSFKKQALDEILLFNEESGTWVLSSHIPGPLCGIATVSVPKIMLEKNKQ